MLFLMLVKILVLIFILVLLFFGVFLFCFIGIICVGLRLVCGSLWVVLKFLDIELLWLCGVGVVVGFLLMQVSLVELIIDVFVLRKLYSLQVIMNMIVFRLMFWNCICQFLVDGIEQVCIYLVLSSMSLVEVLFCVLMLVVFFFGFQFVLVLVLVLVMKCSYCVEFCIL